MTMKSFLLIIIVKLLFYNIILSYDIDNINSNDIFYSKLTNDSSRYIVLLVHRLGLANRLRAISDWYKLAQLSNRTLIIDWKPTYDCNIEFNEIFELGPADLIVLSFHVDNTTSISNLIDEYNHFSNKTISYHVITNNIPFKESLDLYQSTMNVIITNYDGTFVIKHLPCQHYFTMSSRFYQSLEPVSYIKDMLSNIMNRYYKNRLAIGIHYRDHDPIQDWEVAPPDINALANYNTSNPPMAEKFGVGANLNDFNNIMTQINNYFHNNTTNYIMNFIIASNNATIKSYLQAIYPNSIAVQGDNHNRHTNEGMLLSAIEWLLLSECDFIVHTYGSTFASEASIKRMIPIVGIRNHMYVQYNDVRLPQCGNLQFYKANLDEEDIFSYEEGGLGNRKIAASVVRLKASSNLINWGIRESFSL